MHIIGARFTPLGLLGTWEVLSQKYSLRRCYQTLILPSHWGDWGVTSFLVCSEDSEANSIHREYFNLFWGP